VGTTRAVRVIIPVAEVLVIAVLGELIQAFEQVRDLQGTAGVGRAVEDQQQPGPVRQASLGMVPQSEVADLVKTTWQDVLEKPP
jgi:hypothetical protein